MNIGGAIAATAVINILCVGRKFVYQINSSFDHIRYSSKGTTLGKKMFSFGHCPNQGGGRPLLELKNIIYIYICIFDGRKRCRSCPKEGEERKHSFSQEVFPNWIGWSSRSSGGNQKCVRLIWREKNCLSYGAKIFLLECIKSVQD